MGNSACLVVLITITLLIQPFGGYLSDGEPVPLPSECDYPSDSSNSGPPTSSFSGSYRPCFTENEGQLDDDSIMYYALGDPLSVGFLTGGIIFYHDGRDGDPGTTFGLSIGPHRVQPVVEGVLEHHTNFFIGRDPSGWVTGARSYSMVLYQEILENIDLRFYFDAGLLKYDVIVRPGGKPSDLWFTYSDIEGLGIDPSNGDLLIESMVGIIRDMAPIAYQVDEINGIVSNPPCNFRCQGYRFGFSVEGYDRDLPLVIDPGLVFSTFIDNGWGYAVSISIDGAIYTTGYTPSSFPTTRDAFDTDKDGLHDAYLSKFDANGSELLYSTYLGGSERDRAYDLFVDDSGCVYVSGSTNSDDFPVTSGAFDVSYNGGYDAYVLKLNANGSALEHSTYIGGKADEDSEYEEPNRIAVDGNGCVFLAGRTNSTDFPTTEGVVSTNHSGGNYDAYVLKVSADGSSLEYSSYLGGDGNDKAFCIAIDTGGQAHVGGSTHSKDFPTTSGALKTTTGNEVDGFLVKLNASGTSFGYSTYIGGRYSDIVTGIDIDNKGRAVIAGTTNSDNFPVTSGAYDTSINGVTDLFVSTLDASGSSMVASTFIGGGLNDECKDMALDANDDPFLTGHTWSTDFPTTEGAFNRTKSGRIDLLVTKLDSNLSDLIYSTYIGSSRHSFARGLDVDGDGFPVVTGSTYEDDFPTTPGAYNRFGGYGSIVLFKLDPVMPTILYEHDQAIATTGDLYSLNVTVLDNLGVDQVQMRTWRGSPDDFEIVPMALEGGDERNGTWSLTMQMSHHYIGSLHFVIMANDTTGNIGMTPEFLVNVIDNDLPQMEVPGPMVARTGIPYGFMVDVTDNIGFGRIYATYWFDDDPSGSVNISLTGTNLSGLANGTYKAGSLVIPENYTGNLSFFYEAVDSSGNRNTSRTFVVGTVDRGLPLLGPDLTSDTVYRGIAHEFSIVVVDYIKLAGVYLEFWYSEGPHENISLGGQGTFSVEIQIPRDQEGDIHYFFSAVDSSGNWNRTEEVVRPTVNDPPIILHLPTWHVTEGETEVLDLTGHIQDRNDFPDRLAIWCEDPNVTVVGFELHGTFDVWRPQVDIPIEVHDGEEHAEAELVVLITNVNDAPLVASTPPTIGSVGERYLYDLEIWDEDPSEVLTISLVQRPKGMRMDTAGQLTWKPTEDQFGMNHVNVSVSDGRVVIYHTWAIEVAPLGNRPPSFTGQPLGAIVAGKTYRSTVTAEDPDGDVLYYSLFRSPPGASMNNLTGEIVWRPARTLKDTSVEVPFTIKVTDGPASDSLDFIVILMYPRNEPPFIEGVIPDIRTSGTYRLDLTSYMDDPDDPLSNLTWKCVGEGEGIFLFNIEGNELVIEPKDGASGSSMLSLVLEDTSGGSNSQSIEVVVEVQANGSGTIMILLIVVTCVIAAVTLIVIRTQRRRPKETDNPER